MNNIRFKIEEKLKRNPGSCVVTFNENFYNQFIKYENCFDFPFFRSPSYLEVFDLIIEKNENARIIYLDFSLNYKTIRKRKNIYSKGASQ